MAHPLAQRRQLIPVQEVAELPSAARDDKSQRRIEELRRAASLTLSQQAAAIEAHPSFTKEPRETVEAFLIHQPDRSIVLRKNQQGGYVMSAIMDGAVRHQTFAPYEGGGIKTQDERIYRSVNDYFIKLQFRPVVFTEPVKEGALVFPSADIEADAGYRPDIESADKVIATLRGQPVGTYVIRRSTSMPGQYILSVMEKATQPETIAILHVRLYERKSVQGQLFSATVIVDERAPKQPAMLALTLRDVLKRFGANAPYRGTIIYGALP